MDRREARLKRAAPSADQANARRLLQEGKLQAAEQVCLPHLREDTTDAAFWRLGALVAHRAGATQAALARMRRALELDPNDVEALVGAAEIFRVAGHDDEALQAAQRAVERAPHLAAAHNNLGTVLRKLGRLEPARHAFERACALKPDYAKARYNLGLLLDQAGDHAAAVSSYDAALRGDPQHARALLARGSSHALLGRHAHAEQDFRQALSLDPGNREALRRQAALLHELRRDREAEALLRRLADEAPQAIEPQMALGSFYLDLFRARDALACYERVLQIAPDHGAALVNRVKAKLELCDWGTYAADVERLRVMARAAGESPAPLPLAVSHAVRLPFSAQEQKAVADRQARSILDAVAPLRQGMLPPAPRTERAIRIGYLSADFREHALMHLMGSVFRLHDRQRFTVHAYSHGLDDGSPMRKRVEADCDTFIDLRSWGDLDAARHIQADAIDVLVDLTGVSGGGRPGICALRPAPVLVSAVGFPGTMGAGLMDYLLADPIVAPPGSEPDFGERLLRMPHSYLAADQAQAIAETAPPRGAEGLPDAGFVFASFNHPSKLDPISFDAWMRILGRVPGSVLWQYLDGPDSAQVQANLAREAEYRGIDPQRLCYAQRRSKAQHLARLRHADLVLDSFVCNAHTTAVDALWAGVPVLSCPGLTFAARVGASLLTTLGVSELIARDQRDYEERAVLLATTPARLLALRAQVRSARETSPLFDSMAYVRAFEAALEGILRT